MPMPRFIASRSHAGNQTDGLEQFPVDTDIVKVWLKTDSWGELIRIVVMNNHSTTNYRSMREYHHGNTGISINDLTSFTLYSASLGSTQESAITTFVGSFRQSFSVGQVAPWYRGVYEPTSARKRLYKATDPDDANGLIGVLIEQDTKGNLTQVVWYKAKETQVIFAATPATLEFSLVLDRNGAPSLDPNDIGGWTWYYCPSV